MILTRVIPCLLIDNGALVKTIKFKNPSYIGDPINAVKIFNEKEVDEIIILDITASSSKKSPSFKKIEELTSEAFMPFAYGGGVQTIQDMEKLLKIGVEKISINSSAVNNPNLISEASTAFGSQSIIVSMDVKKNFWGKTEVYSQRGNKSTKLSPLEYAKRAEQLGAGELLINSIDRDGTWEGLDIELIKEITQTVNIPVIACGGAGSLSDIQQAIQVAGASAVAVGSMVVYQKKGMGVLINYPNKEMLNKIFT